jgi:hypothetical protein
MKQPPFCLGVPCVLVLEKCYMNLLEEITYVGQHPGDHSPRPLFAKS